MYVSINQLAIKRIEEYSIYSIIIYLLLKYLGIRKELIENYKYVCNFLSIHNGVLD